MATNDAFTEVFGFESGEIVGEPVSEVLVPEDEEVQTRHEEIKQQVLQGEPVDATVRRQTQDGSREFLLRVFPIEVTDGDQGSYAIYTDVSKNIK